MNSKTKILSLLFVDIFVLSMAGYLTLVLRYTYPVSEFVLGNHQKPFIFLLPIWLLFFYIEGLYTIRNQSVERMFRSIARALFINAIIAVIYFYIFTQFNITPKTNIAIFSIIALFLLFIARYLYIKLINTNAFISNTVLIGSKNLCSEIENHIDKNQMLGLKINNTITSETSCIKELGNINLANIDRIAVDSKFLNSQGLIQALYATFPHNIKIVGLIDLLEEISGEIAVENLEKSWMLQNFTLRSNKVYFILKNFFDKIIALVITIFALPIAVILVPLLFIFSGRPILFRQTRTGYLNKTFTLVKLRTMRIDAEKEGAVWAQAHDTRVTKIGRFMRKTRLDEIPQLWNVLRGDMSIVGPRPERPEIIDVIQNKIPFYNERHLVKPGITGWAQVNFGYGSTEEDALKKLKYDLYYTKHKSIWFDLRIILKTVKTVITAVGH